MADDNGHDLPARKVEYLKYIYEHGGTAKTVDLAAHFSVDASTTSKTITDLTGRVFFPIPRTRGSRSPLRGNGMPGSL